MSPETETPADPAHAHSVQHLQQGSAAGAFVRGLRESITIMLGYLPLGISFGIAALQGGIAPWMAVLISIMAYTGAGQFVMVALLGSSASAWSIVISVALMNVRHLFYGLSIMPLLPAHGQRRWPLLLWAAGLTDEVFATAMGRIGKVAPAQRENWYLGLQLGSYAAWVGSTALGALLGQQINRQAQWMQNTLGFVLPALFFALLLELLAHSRWQVIAASMLATALILCVLPTHWAMLGGMLVGAMASATLGYSTRAKT